MYRIQNLDVFTKFEKKKPATVNSIIDEMIK